MLRTILSSLLLSLTLCAHAQMRIIENKQHAFPSQIPAGDYSGITWLGGDQYAVVSDKTEDDGFFIFEIKVDSISGDILSARNLGFRSCGQPNRDAEGIAYVPQTGTIWMSGETDNRIREYALTGARTQRLLPATPAQKRLKGNLGLEALSYNEKTRMMWTCNEADTITVQAYDSALTAQQSFIYHLDKPVKRADRALHYAHGVGTICALDDGSLLLLERELYVPKRKIGSSVHCKLYRVWPGESGKQLLHQWRTGLNLLTRRMANYEGSCLGPTLADGSRVIILLADSQHQYAGVLKDWLKSLKLVQE